MKSTFSIIFYLKRQVVKKDGTVPVMGRITVDGTQAQFSCKMTVNPNLWDTKGGRMTGKSMQALEVNRKLDKMRVSGKSSVSCPLKPSDSAPLKHSTMPP